MAKIRLSGTVLGPNDPSRASRARLLYLLFAGGWDIYNSNGDQRITLSNIEKKIVESDAFVFTPGATLEDMFKAISIFVGFQTLDRNLAGKPTIILNEDSSWDPFFAVLAVIRLRKTKPPSWRHQCRTITSGTPASFARPRWRIRTTWRMANRWAAFWRRIESVVSRGPEDPGSWERW